MKCRLPLALLLMVIGAQSSMAVEPAQPAGEPVVVTARFLSAGRISPYQYGQFMEYLCNLFPAMWADKLCDGGFEGLTPYKVAYLKETDFREHPWYPSGATNRASYLRDSSTMQSGKCSLKIAAEGDTPCTVSVSQDGIALLRDVACTFACFFKQSGLRSAVSVRLHRDATIYARAEFQPGEKWQKHQARLVPSATETEATLTLEFRGPGTLWLDNASLMPENAVSGWRSDVVAAVRAMRPGIIRFGGSTLDDPSMGDFEWKDTIGATDRRRPFRAWGGLQPTGPGLEEFVQFCRLVGAEPLFCVRFTRRQAEDAAEQVEYFNGSAATPMGALRAKNGHAEPYGIRFWQVGNEQRGPDYEKRLPEFCRAMKQADPSIQVLASYPTRGVIEGAGVWLDFVSPHHYDCTDIAGAESDLNSIRRMLRDLAAGRRIHVAVTEWNTTGGDWGPRRARLWTLENALACARYHNLLHRHCDLVAIACRSNLTNSFCSGCIQTDNARLYKTPVYYAQQLFATLAGDRPLQIDSSPASRAALDLSATLSPQGDAVILTAVNMGQQPISRLLDFSAHAAGGEGPVAAVRVWALADTKNAGEPDVANSFAEPERVVPRTSSFIPHSPRFEYRFPPLSLTVLKWAVRSARS